MVLTAAKRANFKSLFYCLIFLHTVHLNFVAAPLSGINCYRNLSPSNRCYYFALPLAMKALRLHVKGSSIFYRLLHSAGGKPWLSLCFFTKALKPPCFMAFALSSVPLRSASNRDHIYLVVEVVIRY